MQQSKHTATTLSGMSDLPNLPNILAYPEILDLDAVPEIKNQFIYIIKNYEDNGLAVVIKREKTGNVYMTIGDWNGKIIDLSKGDHEFYPAAIEFAQTHSSNFVEMMRILGIPQLLIYISVGEYDMKLVDLRSSLNKFYGPGMVKDLFSKIFPTQEVIKTEMANEDMFKAIKNGKGSYKGDLILKCSKFKTITRDKNLLPLYARIIRS